MTEDLERHLPGAVIVPTGVPAELIEHYRRVEIWRKRFVLAFALFLTVGVICFGIVINHQIGLTRDALRQSRLNGELIAEKNDKLQKQVDSARDLLTQLYAALNDSQRQVIALGGQPIHFEFTVPTTVPHSTTTQPPSGAPASTSPPPPTVGAAGVGDTTVGLDHALILGLVFTPLLVLLPTTIPLPDTTPTLTVPDVSIPPLTVPDTIPDTVPVTLPVPPPPLGFG